MLEPYKLVETRSNLLKPVRTCSNPFELVKTRSNLLKLVHSFIPRILLHKINKSSLYYNRTNLLKPVRIY